MGTGAGCLGGLVPYAAADHYTQGTALRGFAELEVHHNGHTFFRGHLHNSSDIVDYKALVRATLDFPPPSIRPPAGSPGQALVFQQSGEVENNFDWFDAQYHPLIQASWGEVERATVGIAKSYEMTGLIDDIGQLALDSISFVLTSATVGGAQSNCDCDRFLVIEVDRGKGCARTQSVPACDAGT